MSQPSFLPDRPDWPSAVGLFLLNFGTLEYFVFVFLEVHLAPDEFEKVRNSHLKDRLDRIKQCLAETAWSPQQRTGFDQLVERLRPIRELRNHIAHGHFFTKPDGLTGAFQITLLPSKYAGDATHPDAKLLTLQELTTALQTLTTLIEEFKILAGFQNRPPSPSEQE